MTKTKIETGNGSAAQPVILFGTDEHEKPRAARFSGAQAELALKAAALSNLHSHIVQSSEVADVAAKLPAGRIYANGRGFVPYVRRDLYAKLLQAVGHKNETTSTSPAPSLPENWDEIGPGHLVLYHESLEDGWWEAVVVARDDEMLTVKIRDYPKYPPLKCHYASVALIKPTPPAP